MKTSLLDWLKISGCEPFRNWNTMTHTFGCGLYVTDKEIFELTNKDDLNRYQPTSLFRKAHQRYHLSLALGTIPHIKCTIFVGRGENNHWHSVAIINSKG